MRNCPLIIEKGNVLYIGRMLKLNWYLNEQRKEPEIDMKKILSLFIACSILTSVISFVPVFGAEDKEVYFSMDDIATDMQLLPKGGIIDQYSDEGNAVLRMKSPATAEPPIARFMIDQRTNPYISIDFDFKMVATPGKGYFNICTEKSGDYNKRMLSLGIADGGFFFNGDGGTKIPAKYETGKWCNIRITADCLERVLDIAIDGVTVAREYPFKNRDNIDAGAIVGRIDFNLETGENDCYIDNLRVKGLTEEECHADYYINQKFTGYHTPPATYNCAGDYITFPPNGYMILSQQSTAEIQTYGQSAAQEIFECDLRNTTSRDSVLALRSGGKDAVLLYINSSEIGSKDADGRKTPLAEFPVGIWKHIKVVIDSHTGTFDFWANGDLIAADIPFADISAAAVDSIWIQGPSAGYIHIDNIELSPAFFLTDSAINEAELTLDFSSEVDPSTVSVGCFQIKGSGSVPAVKSAAVQGSRITVILDGWLDSSAQYSADITGLKSIDGILLQNTTAYFETPPSGEVTVRRPVFAVGEQKIAALQDGDIRITLPVRNESSEEKSGVLIAALKKGNRLLGCSVTEQMKISGEGTAFKTDIRVQDAAEERLELFFVSGLSELRPYMDMCVLDKDGMRYTEPVLPDTYQTDFETANDAISSVLSGYIAEENGNHFVRLRNTVTPMLFRNSWEAYEIHGKLKVEERSLDSTLARSAFEVVTRQEPNEAYGSVQPVTALYLLGENADYLGVDSSIGYGVAPTGVDWVDFSVVVNGNQTVFTVNKNTKYYNLNTAASGGIRFRASNCTVCLDDLEIVPVKALGGDFIEQISVTPQETEMNCYDSLRAGEIASVKAQYRNGVQSFLAKEQGLSWKVTQGGDALEILEEDTLRWKEGTVPGTKVVLTGTYKNKTVSLTVKAVSSAEDEVQYIKETIPKRQLEMLNALRKNSVSLVSYDPADYEKMTGRTKNLAAKILLDPMEENYDDKLQWLIDISKWELEKKGHGLAVTDFNLMQLFQLRKELYGKANISQEMWDTLEHYLQTAEYVTRESGVSENHQITYLATAMAVCEMWPEAVMHNGKTGAENLDLYREEIKGHLERRLKYGWMEFDGMYVNVSATALMFITDYVQDPETRQLAAGALEVLMADSVVDNVDGLGIGARSRVYGNLYLEAGTTAAYMLTGQYTASSREKYAANSHSAVMLLSGHVPSDTLVSIAADRNKEYVNKERKQVFQLPDDPAITESVKKYTYVTSDYALGAINQFDQVPGLTSLRKPHSIYEGVSTWVPQGHQEMPWSLYFAGTQASLIFDSHPRGSEQELTGQHNYWTGDVGCLDARYFQEENVLLGMHHITRANELQFTHFYIPKGRFEETVEKNGWIFIKQGRVYAAIKPLKDGAMSNEAQYSWVTAGAYANSEIRIDSPDTAFVCEVVNESQYTKGFEQFQKDVAANPLTYSTSGDYQIEYTGLNGKTLTLDYGNSQNRIDGNAVDYGTYKLYDSPYMQSEWGSGTVDILYNGKGLRINLKGEMTELG